MYTLYFKFVGKKSVCSLINLISSTPLFDAASISIMSTFAPSEILIHSLHFRQGFPSLLLLQLIAFANILAILVFPVPLTPVNRYACPSLFSFI